MLTACVSVPEEDVTTTLVTVAGDFMAFVAACPFALQSTVVPVGYAFLKV